MEKRWIWPFELEEQIGSGAMGVVYRARYVKNDRRVALKLLPKEVAANPTLAARFQREMELLKDLKHPHIVNTFGGTCEGDQWFYAMELLEGGTLGSMLLEQGKFPWRDVIEFGLQICAALEFAHSHGVIHRDLKPGNLLLMRSGKVKLVDFGLALVAAETRLTATGKTMGSLLYMAPEQISGKPPLSNKTDLYALGCVLFELLCGRTPFIGEGMAEILQQHLRKPPPKPSTFALDCPPQLDSLIGELLEKDPERRPESAAVVAERLREIDRDITVKAPRYDKHRPLEVAGKETATAVIPTVASSGNRWLVAGLALAIAVMGWLSISKFRQARLNDRVSGMLLETLKDTKQPQNVRVFAARSLGQIGPEAHEALTPLVEILKDPDVAVRIGAAKAIGEIGTGDAYLLASLKKLRERDEFVESRTAIDAAVEQLKDKPPGGSILLYIVVGALAIMGGGGYWVWKQAQAT